MVIQENPILECTPVKEISPKVANVRQAFHDNKTRDVEFRLVQLRSLFWAIKDHESEIEEALRLDLGRSLFESHISEIIYLQNEIIFVSRNLHNWVKDEKAPDIELTWKAMSPKFRKDPLGCVLVIGPFNYPILLTLGPVIGAISAGNTVVMKPSEKTPHSSAVIQKLVATALDPSCYAVVQGGVPETQALLAERWDKIFFTGSATVGRVVAKAASNFMTPVVLELGGLNPAFVTKNADPRLVARRMLWGKAWNAGQTCTSENYLLVEKEIVPAVIEEFKKAHKAFYPNGAKTSPDISRIVDEASFNRIKCMIDSTKGKIIVGGAMDEKDRFIEPTIVQVDSIDDPLLTQESFGPIITILPVDTLDEALKIANGIHSTPLAVYPFGNKKEVEKILQGTRSGGVAVNDAALHISTLPFGGVGESGYGEYRGRASFDCFTHRRPITTSPGWVETLLSLRYPPYAGKLSKFRMASALQPDFDRSGRKVRFGWLSAILTLSGGTARAGVGRAAVLAVVAYYLVQILGRQSSKL